MSKLNSDKINFDKDDFLVEVSDEIDKHHITNHDLILNRAQNEAEQEIESAQKQAIEIIESAKIEAEQKANEIIESAQNSANSIVEEAQKQANDILEEANAQKNEILTNSTKEVETASQEAANKGYEEGYKDAQDKFLEENEEKINAFDKFCLNQNIVRDKILKNSSREILNIIQNISKIILIKELDSETLEKIIKKTISLCEEKDNIKIILSEKYAKLLYELQKKDIEAEFNFEDFKQYEGFSVLYNKELDPDTIIIENPKERFCASIKEQLDKIMRDILENTQNGNIDLEEYDETSRTE